MDFLLDQSEPEVTISQVTIRTIEQRSGVKLSPLVADADVMPSDALGARPRLLRSFDDVVRG